MSNLDHLVAKIAGDSEARAKEIIKTAENQASEIINKAISEAEVEKSAIISAAKAEAERTAEQLILAKKLEIRNMGLQKKQEVIDRVFNLAIERLNNMPENEYLNYIRKALLQDDIEGAELAIPKKYKIDINKINSYLEKNGGGKLSLCKDEMNVDGGYILIKDDIEQNNTFRSAVEYHRYELEGAIMKALFGAQAL